MLKIGKQKVSDYSVDSSRGATDMHVGVKPTFTSHIPAEQTEQYFMSAQNISKPIY